MDGARRLFCRPEFEITHIAYTVLAPELISLRRIFRIRIHNHLLTSRAPKEKHPFHFVKFKLALMLIPKRVAVLAYQVANFAEKEVASDRELT